MCTSIRRRPRTARRPRRAREALRRIGSILSGVAEQPDPGVALRVDEAFALFAERLSEMRVPEPQRADALEAVGWLELLHDPAPMCVVLGMHDAHVPGRDDRDPLLTLSTRERLIMPTDDDRLARDIYLAGAIHASRDAVFLGSRTAPDGEPETPSRVLMRTDPDGLARRVLAFTGDRGRGMRTRSPNTVTPGGVDLFAPTACVGEGYAPPDSMGVTEFDAYIRSPMGWYLERYMKLRDPDPAPREMDAAMIGSLAHNALKRFGLDEDARELDDPERIMAALSHMLDAERDATLGRRPPGGGRAADRACPGAARAFRS